jgi:hypothetical protein
MVRTVAVAIQDAWDRYASLMYYPVTLLLFSLVVLFNWWYGEKLAADWEQWTIADWLISYAPGFVRRGLSGEVLMLTSRTTMWPANRVVLWSFVGLFALFGVVFMALLSRRRITFWYFVLCVSPGFVLFTFYNPSAVGRKESLIFVLFSLWALLAGGVRRSAGLHLVFGGAAAILTLMHEVFFFFSPYFVLFAYLAERLDGGGRTWVRSLAIPLSSGLILACILGYSASLNDPRLCQRIIGLGAPAKVCEGVLEYRSAPPVEAVTRFTEAMDSEMFISFGLMGAVILGPLYLFLISNAAGQTQPFRVMGFELVLLLFSLPLFVLAVDWGRWVSIHVILATILGAVFLPRRGAERPPSTIRGGSWLAGLAGLLVLASMLTWSVNYCCGGDILRPLGPMDALEGVWEDLEL